jgi:murein DD-endopeptidase MepM/ murein hydrolase activator NlpD
MIIRDKKIIKEIKSVLPGFFIIFFCLTDAEASINKSKSFETLKSIEVQDETIKSIRKDIRNTIIVIKKRKMPDNLPELKFYKYKVKQNDNFWKILSKTSLNIDTLSAVNSLPSPLDVIPGKEIFLSNMRGVIHKVNANDTIEDISQKYNIGKEYICKVNKIIDNKINKEYLFIPSGEFSNMERSLFLGTGFASPLKQYTRTSTFGRRIDPFNKKFGFHTGLDLACPVGSNVYAARKGKVIFSGYEGGYGLLLILKHEHGYSSYYGHLKKILQKEGDTVERGSLIGISGDSGRSTGPHLHFEVRKQTRPINPGLLL